MKKTILAVLFSLLAFTASAAEAEELYRQGVECYESNELLAAMNCFARAYEDLPYDGRDTLSFNITSRYVYTMVELGRFADVVVVCNAAIETARAVGDSSAAMVFTFYKAMALYDAGEKQESKETMNGIVPILQKLSTVTTEEVMMACNSMALAFNEEEYDLAVQRGNMALAMIDKCSEPVGTDLKSQLYGLLAAAYFHTGNKKAAKESERRYWEEEPGRNTPSEGGEGLLNYYLCTRNYDLAEKVLLRRLKASADFPDTLNTYHSNTLSHLAELYYGQKRYKEACEMQEQYADLQRQINEKAIQDRLLDLEDEYEDLQLSRETEKAKHEVRVFRLWLTIALAVLLLLFLINLQKRRSMREIKAKNAALTELIGKLDNQRHILKERLEEASSDSEDKEIFMRLEKLMDNEKLYLDPNIGRDRIVELLGVTKNDLPGIIKKYSADTGLPTYISRKRIEHALKLQQEHPDWQMKKIVLSSGFSSSASFYRSFNALTGMTPTEYFKAKGLQVPADTEE